MAVNSLTNQIYVANNCIGAGWPTNCTICSSQFPNGTVTDIDGATLSTQNIPVGCGPENLAINSQTNMIYAVNLRALGTLDGTVTAIDGSTLATQSVPTDGASIDIAADSLTNKIYVVPIQPVAATGRLPLLMARH
jgi:DNA-binding beta-propeller fold protein YncE